MISMNKFKRWFRRMEYMFIATVQRKISTSPQTGGTPSW